MNKTALILGGSSGLGLATAKKLACEGYSICIVHRDRKATLDAFYEEIDKMKANGVKVNTFNKNALEKSTIIDICKSFKENSISLLVHSIARGNLKSLVSEEQKKLSKEDLDITIHAMATNWLEWTQHLFENNLFTNNARNIAFTSEGNSKVWEGYAAVSAAKATLESLMRSMAVAYAPYGISTNCIQAGVTVTNSFKMIPNSEKLAAIAQKRNPFKRLTTPNDIANVVYLLSKPEAAWINGTILKADGGESLI